MKTTTQSARFMNMHLARNQATKHAFAVCTQTAQSCSIVEKAQRSFMQTLRISNITFLLFWAALAAGGAFPAAAEMSTLDVMIVGGEVQGDTTLRVTQGVSVVVNFTSDTAVALHLHGYDVEVHIVPGKPSTLKLDATIAGRFAMEIHGHAHGKGKHRTLLYLEVHPR